MYGLPRRSLKLCQYVRLRSELRRDSLCLNSQKADFKRRLAGATGLEPATSAVTGQRSKPIELRPHAKFIVLGRARDGGR